MKEMKKLLLVGIVAFAMLATAGLASALDSIDVDFSGAGMLYVDAQSTFNNGSFIGIGPSYTANIDVNADYKGQARWNIDAVTSSGFGGQFQWVSGWDLDYVTGTPLPDVKGNAVFNAYIGGNDSVQMHLNFDGACYDAFVYGDGTGASILSADGGGALQFGVATTEASVDAMLSSDNHVEMNAGLYGHTAKAVYDWGAPGTTSIKAPYYGNTNVYTWDFAATGKGSFLENGFGANVLNFNGINMPGGGIATISASFNDGFAFSSDVYGT